LKSIVEQSSVKIDTILTYCRGSLIDDTYSDFADYFTVLSFMNQSFQSKNIGIINAAPTCMGLLTSQGPQHWHPAAQLVKDTCEEAVRYCEVDTLRIDSIEAG